MGEKTEKATPKKMRDARKKGQIAKSQDFPSAVTFIASMCMTLSTVSFFFSKLGSFLLSALKMVDKKDLDLQAPIFASEMLSLILTTSLPLLTVVTIVGIAATFLINGPLFSLEVMKPNLKKFNPIDNIKQKFKLKTFIELGKSLIKIFGAALLIYCLTKKDMGKISSAVFLPPIACAYIFKTMLIKIVIWIGIFFIVVALADLIYQKISFANEMKMEKFEIKQEYKDTEGNPEVRGRRRQIAQEIAYEDPGIQEIKHAKTIVSNPQDIAIAIGYAPDKYKAPWIIAKGADHIARLILAEAEKYKIPIMRNVPLAHVLFDEGKIKQFIPESTYDMVGEILLYVISLQANNDFPNNQNPL